jgi:hypothetical protein
MYKQEAFYMLEAVNSVISNAPLIRGNAEQVATARSFAANPERVQEVAQAPYVSPYIHVDVNYNKAVLQLRNGETGDVETQIPSEERLAQIRDAEQRRQVDSLEAQGTDPSSSREQAPAPDTGNAVVRESRPAPTSPSASTPVQASPQQLAAFEAGAQAAQTSGGESGTVSVTA